MRESRKFNCNICDYNTAKKGSIQTHLESLHKGVKPILCNVCGIKTAVKESLNKLHVEKKAHICPLCQKSFPSKIL